MLNICLTENWYLKIYIYKNLKTLQLKSPVIKWAKMGMDISLKKIYRHK